MRSHTFRFGAMAIGLLIVSRATAAPPYRSHPPLRPLPVASVRPMDQGPAKFVDPIKGDDANAGSEAKPWRTLGHAIPQLKPGDTLYLRGGTYYENVAIACTGEAGKPITIRAYSGELAVIDGGFREFLESPATAWEPVTDGAPNEFRSTKAYPGLKGKEKQHPAVFGNFADSMVPLHGYGRLPDFRSDNPYWSDKGKSDAAWSISCGPGVFYHTETERIHIRLAHQTHWTFLEAERRYRGEIDPRKLPLIIGGGLAGNHVRLTGCRHLRLQDLVFRGCSPATIAVGDCRDLALEGLTLYACSGKPFNVTKTVGLAIKDCAFRGVAAPWTSRSHLKYRGVEAKVFSTYITEGNRDFEISHSEFTDACDGLFLGQAKNVDFHHNLVDNFSDDGFNLSAIFDADVVGDFGDIRIHENRISRCLGMFVFGGRREGHKTKAGSGVSIYRNILDLRPPVFYQIPKDDLEAAEVMAARGHLMGDHGHGLWEPVRFYHNTVLMFQGAARGDYAGGAALGASRSPEWRVLNNIFVQVEKPLGAYVFSKGDGSNLEADGNLHWSLQDDSLDGNAFRDRLQVQSAKIARSNGAKTTLEVARWGKNDRVADPKFAKLAFDWRLPSDLRLSPGSPAIDAGVEVPADWPDPFRSMDKGKPDLGAIPGGIEAFRVGPKVTPARLRE